MELHCLLPASPIAAGWSRKHRPIRYQVPPVTKVVALVAKIVVDR